MATTRSGFDVVRTMALLSRRFWFSAGSGRAWLLTIGAFGMALVDVFMQVLLNRWNKFFYDSLERKSVSDLQHAALLFLALVAATTATVVLAQLTRLLLQIDWRKHLTERIISLWLKNQAFYRLNVINGAEFAPEARIADDVRATVEPIVDLVIGFLTALVTFVAFVGVLWNVGGSITVADVTIPGFMVFAAVAYALIVSLLMMLVGSSYAERIRQRSEAEAQFRYQLTRLRENAESVALVRGEEGETRNLLARFAVVATEWGRFANRWSYMTVVSWGNGLAAPIVPVLLMAPKYLSGEASLGTVTQAAAAFGTVQAALAWVTANFARLSEWYAAASRVAELGAYIRAAALPGEADSRIVVKESPDDKLHLENVAVKLHTGRALIADAAFTIAPGEMVMVSGKSGTGKSTLVRAIAGLWPWGTGAIMLPKDAPMVFVPQRPYLPIGTLKAVLTYPRAVTEFGDGEVREALEACGLDHLKDKLDEHAAWDRVLSGGEQQRISFARLIIHQPSIVILDEATSALDEENQARMMELFQSRLHSAAVISVAHRPSLARYHSRQITLKKQKSGARTFDRIRQLSTWARMRDAVARRPKRIGPSK